MHEVHPPPPPPPHTHTHTRNHVIVMKSVGSEDALCYHDIAFHGSVADVASFVEVLSL